jgi:hypothetical protein
VRRAPFHQAYDNEKVLDTAACAARPPVMGIRLLSLHTLPLALKTAALSILEMIGAPIERTQGSADSIDFVIPAKAGTQKNQGTRFPPSRE